MSSTSWFLVVTQIEGHPACTQTERDERHALNASTEHEANLKAAIVWSGFRHNFTRSRTGEHYPRNPRLIREEALPLQPI